MKPKIKGMRSILLLMFVAMGVPAVGQQNPSRDIAFVSDTQAPMWVEKIFLDYNQNEKATSLVFDDILKKKPQTLFILGDVVSLGPRQKRWKSVDSYLYSFKNLDVEVTALLGNHDVMRNAKKGERNFQKRFPNEVRTGFYKITDSIAVVMLNSNFKKLSPSDFAKQQTWLASALQNLDNDPSVYTIIVTCHHAPYTNSKVVGSSKEVQRNFVPLFLGSKKSKLFITGHSHDYEHFKKGGKDFLVIGGGGGLHHPLDPSSENLNDLSGDYKPLFHYLMVSRIKNELSVTSFFLKPDLTAFEKGNSFRVPVK